MVFESRWRQGRRRLRPRIKRLRSIPPLIFIGITCDRMRMKTWKPISTCVCVCVWICRVCSTRYSFHICLWFYDAYWFRAKSRTRRVYVPLPTARNTINLDSQCILIATKLYFLFHWQPGQHCAVQTQGKNRNQTSSCVKRVRCTCTCTCMTRKNCFALFTLCQMKSAVVGG